MSKLLLFVYLYEDQLLVLLQVQGCIDVSRDSLHLFGVAVVECEPCVPPHFTACVQKKFKHLVLRGDSCRAETLHKLSCTEKINQSTFKKIGLVGSLRVDGSVQVSREFPPQSVDLYRCVMAQVCDGPDMFTTESKSFIPWT